MIATFAERLRAALLERGMSQAELARRTGLEQGNISRYCHGKHRPQRAVMTRILEALGMTMAEFASAGQFAPDERQLHLRCEIEVLLQLADQLVQAHRRSGGGLPGQSEADRQIVEATVETVEAKIAEVRVLNQSPTRL